MPLPTPGDEDEKVFMKRCMSDDHMNEKFPDQAQRAAVCYKQFRGVEKMSGPTETRVSISKLDAKKQIAYGAVYVPYVPDSQGDFMTPEEIERVAHNFLKKGAVEAIDTEHNLVRNGSAAVESFIARPGDPDFVIGTWVLGVHIPDKELWAKAERGEIGGFSMYGTGRRQQRIVEIEVPDEGVLFGKTEASSGLGAHEHVYALDFDAKGNFLGGETDEVNGHTHLIRKGTVTEPGPDGHRHRFSFVDTLVKGCGPLSEDQKGWQKKRKELRKSAWNEEDHPRGKTTPESTPGSFAPRSTTSISNGGPEVGGGGGGGETVADLQNPERRPGEGEMAYNARRIAGELARGNPGMTAEQARAAERKQYQTARAARDAAERAPKPVELTRSGHRPLSTIAREIRRDWGAKVNFGAKPYLSALASLHDIKDNYGMDSAQSVVAYFLSNASTWRGPKAKEIKAELRKIIGVKKEDMTADDLPTQDGEQKQALCEACNTPKGCKKAGRCLISYEEDEDEDEDE